MYKLFALVLIAAAFSVSSAIAQEYRNFTGSNGRIIEAAFLGFDEATQIVKLRLRDGREQNVKLDLFSAESQQWIKTGGKDADNPFGDDAPSGDVEKAGDRKVLTINRVQYPFRWCPSGTFKMGSPNPDRGDGREHPVTLTRGFWTLESTVTQEMWQNVMRNNPSENKGGKLPVTNVSWDDSQEYIRKLNALGVAPAGYRFSLPTEAQWEYACRAGTTTAYSFGDTLSKEQANFGNNVGKPTEAGKYPANAWGLYDMHGNVWEWCLCWNGDYPNGAVTDPTGASSGSRRIIRGASWPLADYWLRSAWRNSDNPQNRSQHIGLRLVLVRVE